MSKKLQITISDRVYVLLKKEVEMNDAHLLTYAAILFSEYLIDRAKKKRFDDGFG